MLFEDAAAAYLSDRRKRLRRCTIAGYESAISRHLAPRWSGVELESMEPEDVQGWVDSIALPGAARKAYKTLRQVIRWCIRRGLVRMADPTACGVELPRVPRREPEVLDASETRDVLRALWGHECEAVAICAATLGLRRGEACGLKWSDIDLRTGEVRVRRSRQSVGGEEVVEPPKTERSARSCWLPRFAVRRLRQIRGGASGWLCGLSPDATARRIRSACRRAGARYLSMTSMRHSWATLAVEAGVGIETVAMMLGHSGISTAYEHYIVPRKRICQDAQKAWERALMASA